MIGNRIKTTIFLAALVGLFVAVGYLIGNTGGMIIAFVIAMIFNFGSYWFSDKIVLKMHRAKEVSTDHKLYRIVDELRQIANLPMPKVYLIATPSPNAFATGRSPKKAAVAASQSLVDMLSDDELKGVMAHELSHVKHRDTLIQTLAVGIAAAIAMFAEMMQWALIFGFGRGDDNGIGNIAGALLIIILTPIIASVIQLAISRQREFMADEGAARITRNPMSLVSALEKLENAAFQSSRRGVKATRTPAESLYIVNPFKGSSIAQLFSTHPPTEKRVAALKKLRF